MWECPNCQESIEEKYKNCWNCGKPKPTPDLFEEIMPPKPETPPIIEPIPALVPDNRPPIELPNEPEQIEFEPTEPESNETPSNNSQLKEKPNYESDFLSGFGSAKTEKEPSKLGPWAVFLLWLGALVATAVFAYLSNQKMLDFFRKIEEERQNFIANKGEFVFPPKPPLTKGSTIDWGNFKPKVLPLNLKSGEVENLFLDLPDDLRPTNSEEVKTLMWFDCKNTEVGRYTDGKIGFQENCQIYLVDRESSKFIGVQDFLGIMPALSKERSEGDSVGKVLPEKYIAFLKGKQAEAERTEMQWAADSPNHHFFSKSEFIYSILLLGVLVAIGFGWFAFKIKFDWDAE